MRRLLLVAFVGAAFSLGGAQQPKPRTSGEKSQTAQVEQSAATTTQAIRDVSPEKDKGCPDRKDQRSSDLCAQWSAVDAARNAAKATWAAVFLTFAGTFLIFLTFLEQRKTGRRQVRAYILAEGIEIQTLLPGEPFRGLLTFENCGQTPAFEVQTQNAFFFDVEPYDHHFERLPEQVSNGNLAAAGKGYHHLNSVERLNEATINELLARTRHLVVYGRITYLDVFKKPHTTLYRFHLEPGEPVGGKWELRFAVSKEGNGAN